MDINEIIKQVTEEVCAKYGGETAQSAGGGDLSPGSLAKYIDHTILKANASIEDVKKVCDEAKKYHFASVCVNPSYIKFVAGQLEGSGVAPCCVIGFPLGACTPEAKAYEASDAASNGAKEVDMVINIGAIKSKDWMLVKRDVESVVNAVKGRAILKVIIETCLLTDEEKVKACAISKMVGADFVKTSTGFSTGGATVEDVRLMRETVGPDIGVKASGGVKTYQDAVNMIRAGANRLGTSSGAAIVSGDGGGEKPHECINCGACRGTCPSGRVQVTKDSY